MKKLLVVIILFSTTLTAMAAAADFHPDGYDETCLLCQVNHLPLAESLLPCYLPEKELFPWWDYESCPARRIESPLSLESGRSPPRF